MKSMQEIWDECQIYLGTYDIGASMKEMEYFTEKVYEEYEKCIGVKTVDRYQEVMLECLHFCGNKLIELTPVSTVRVDNGEVL